MNVWNRWRQLKDKWHNLSGLIIIKFKWLLTRWLTFLQRNSSGGQLLSGWKQSPLNDCGSDFQVWMWRVRPHQTSPTGLHQSPGLRPGIWRVAAVSWWGSSGGDQRLESCTAVHWPWGWCTFAANTHSGIAPVIDNSSSSVHCLFCVGVFQIFNFRYFCFSFWIRTTQNTQVSKWQYNVWRFPFWSS